MNQWPDRGSADNEPSTLEVRGANDGSAAIPKESLERVLRALPTLPEHAENEAEVSDFEALLAADPEFSEHCDRARDAWIEAMERALDIAEEQNDEKGSDHERA